jgi:hypothetical protein
MIALILALVGIVVGLAIVAEVMAAGTFEDEGWGE